jgi:hypothetical protein
MTTSVIRFPTQAVVICRAPEGGWYVLGERGNGWLHGSRRDAVQDAKWLSKNLNLVVREVSS